MTELQQSQRASECQKGAARPSQNYRPLDVDANVTLTVTVRLSPCHETPDVGRQYLGSRPHNRSRTRGREQLDLTCTFLMVPRRWVRRPVPGLSCRWRCETPLCHLGRKGLHLYHHESGVQDPPAGPTRLRGPGGSADPGGVQSRSASCGTGAAYLPSGGPVEPGGSPHGDWYPGGPVPDRGERTLQELGVPDCFHQLPRRKDRSWGSPKLPGPAVGVGRVPG